MQHALRAHTPDDAKALRATVSTFPTSEYDLEKVLTELGIGEAVVTVLNEKGTPTPVARTMLRAPISSMDPCAASVAVSLVEGSAALAKYGQLVDRESAYELLLNKLAPPAGEAPRAKPDPGLVDRIFSSKAVSSFLRSAGSTAGREIFRGIFGVGKRT